MTDNQHVASGDVIARIDDRDYRNALAQAQAQVAAAQASIENIDAQTTVQQAQINANQAQVDQAQATLVFGQQQAARYQQLAKPAPAPFRTPSNTPRNCISRRLRLRVRKRNSNWHSGKSSRSRRSATARSRTSLKPRLSATKRN